MENDRNDSKVMLVPTVFNQTDDHIIDSKCQQSPSEVYEEHIKNTFSKEEEKEHAETLHAKKEETSIDRIKRKYMKEKPTPDQEMSISLSNKCSGIDSQLQLPSKIDELYNSKASIKSNKKAKKKEEKKKKGSKVKEEKRKADKKTTNSNIQRTMTKSKSSTSMNNKNQLQKSSKKERKPSNEKLPQRPSNKDLKQVQKCTLSDILEIIKSHAHACKGLKKLLEDKGISVQ